jgi:hypothetical protein
VTLLVMATAVLFVVVPLLFWRDTWFGRELTNAEIGEYLAGHAEKPRKTQHALVQISERISRQDPAVRQWYPRILELADNPLPELRLTVAWLMGQDPRHEEFHQRLLKMLGDDSAMVRRNAALSLAAFGDRAARPELVAMLHPVEISSPQAGVLTNRLQQGDRVDRGTLLGRIALDSQAEPAEVRSPLPGFVRQHLAPDGTQVQPGQQLVVIGPDPDHVYEALRALYLVGMPQDVEDVRPFLRPSEEMPPQVNEQARLTVERLRNGEVNREP